MGYRQDGMATGGRNFGECGAAGSHIRKRIAQPCESYHLQLGCYEACGRAFGDLYASGNEIGREYLRKHGFDDDDAARFGLGFTRSPKSIMPEFNVSESHAVGFITIPFWNRDFTSANYCVLRAVSGNDEVGKQEWHAESVAGPLYNEWMLSASLPIVFVAKGLFDAIALAKITEQPVVALGGVSNAKRLTDTLYRIQPDMRPRIIAVCMDEDDEGHAVRDAIMADLAGVDIARAAFGPYPRNAINPNAWLTSGQGIDWDYVLRQGPAGIDPLYATEWCDGR